MPDRPSVPRANSAGSLIIAGTASNTGKTTVTLAALRAMRRKGLSVSSAKAGPDYIDPAFHRTASGAECMNLDTYAMSAGTLNHILGGLQERSEYTLIEGVMGLFDGSAVGPGSTAEIAGRFGLPVLLTVNVAGESESAAAVVRGFMTHNEKVRIAGAVLNQAASARHGEMCRVAVEKVGCPVISVLPRQTDLALEGRHLGLKQAEEAPDLEAFMERAADWFERHTDWPAFLSLFRPPGIGPRPGPAEWGTAPPGAHTAAASDRAFRFFYPHLAAAWRERGAKISLFSPLAGETPHPAADAIYFPGGYPELHAREIAGKKELFGALRRAAGRGVPIFGECGGYMILGESITDGEGRTHPMAELLPVEFTMQDPERHLGYRKAALREAALGEEAGARFHAHEFHYASIRRTDPYSDSLKALFEMADSEGNPLGPAGHMKGSVAGSFIHIIDRVRDQV
ncbi:MAG: cobyrinate a,c-diamide synthase [Nitrospinota bacterium]